MSISAKHSGSGTVVITKSTAGEESVFTLTPEEAKILHQSLPEAYAAAQTFIQIENRSRIEKLELELRKLKGF